MSENELLEQVMEVLETTSEIEAYNFLKENKVGLGNVEISSQMYNFLYCLAALSSLKEEALQWIEEAIVTKGMWYRPQVFEDEDLKLIKNEPRFIKCQQLSKSRYLKAQKESESICTWNNKSKDDLLLAFHGNQQNILIAKDDWGRFDDLYQVEYLQSKEVDSYQLFRWEDLEAGCSDVINALAVIDLDCYKTVTFGGFSAGCDTLLKTIATSDFSCDFIVLQSPWIPWTLENMEVVLSNLKHKGIKVIVLCGELDTDCMPLAEKLVETGQLRGNDIQGIWFNTKQHGFFEELDYIKLINERWLGEHGI